jgi:hypothetical protein
LHNVLNQRQQLHPKTSLVMYNTLEKVKIAHTAYADHTQNDTVLLIEEDANTGERTEATFHVVGYIVAIAADTYRLPTIGLLSTLLGTRLTSRSGAMAL